MSNPAVLSLASLDTVDEAGYRFEIEDNIGEAVHIHYKEIRLDLTVREFYEIAYKMEAVIEQIVDVEGFSCMDFDPVHLAGLSGLLEDLEKITYDEVYLEDLQIETYDKNGREVLRPLTESRILKALHGRTAENDSRRQVNYYDAGKRRRSTNMERLEYNLERIRQEGYPAGNELITLFHDKNRIYDGQHRASCLYFLYGNIKVKVRRLWFRNFSHDGDHGQQGSVEYLSLEDGICIMSEGRIKEISLDLSGLAVDTSQWKVVLQRGRVL